MLVVLNQNTQPSAWTCAFSSRPEPSTGKLACCRRGYTSNAQLSSCRPTRPSSVCVCVCVCVCACVCARACVRAGPFVAGLVALLVFLVGAVTVSVICLKYMGFICKVQMLLPAVLLVRCFHPAGCSSAAPFQASDPSSF